MKTVKETKPEQKEVKVELKEAFVLWKVDSKSGVEYLSGNTAEGTKLVGFFTTNKTNPKQPDVKVYTVDDNHKRDIEVASLWSNVSKNDKKYLTGTTNEKEDLVAFYNDQDDKKPYIRAYYKQK